MTLCLDASLVLAALLPLPSSLSAKQLLSAGMRSEEPLVAPPLLYAETTSVLRRHVHIGVIHHQEAVTALQDLFALPISPVHDARIHLRALELARRLGHAKAYDVQYLAVAELRDCPIVTLDRGLHESARTLGIPARLLS